MSRARNLFLVAGAVIAGCFLPGMAMAAQDSDRGEQWEFYIPINYYGSQSFDREGGTTLDINGDIGWGFGFGYNLNDHLNLGFEFTWTDTSYDAFINSELDPDFTVGGTLEANTGQFVAQYNFTQKTVTPFITAGLGWTYVDSNIPNAPPQSGCWWDPWYGYICTSWQPTATDTGFSYSVSAGLRFEVTDTFYFEGAYKVAWIDFDSADTMDFDGYRFDIGWRF